MNALYVPVLMDKLLEYINNENNFDKQTDYFIKGENRPYCRRIT